MRRHNAKYHHRYHNDKLEHATEIQNSPDESHSKMRRTSMEMQMCFLCEKVESESELRYAMTMQLNERLNESRNPNDG